MKKSVATTPDAWSFRNAARSFLPRSGSGAAFGQDLCDRAGAQPVDSLRTSGHARRAEATGTAGPRDYGLVGEAGPTKHRHLPPLSARKARQISLRVTNALHPQFPAVFRRVQHLRGGVCWLSRKPALPRTRVEANVAA